MRGARAVSPAVSSDPPASPAVPPSSSPSASPPVDSPAALSPVRRQSSGRTFSDITKRAVAESILVLHERNTRWKRDYRKIKWMPYDLFYGKVRSETLTVSMLIAWAMTCLRGYFDYIIGVDFGSSFYNFLIAFVLCMGQSVLAQGLVLGNSVLQPRWMLVFPIGIGLAVITSMLQNWDPSNTNAGRTFGTDVIVLVQSVEFTTYLAAMYNATVLLMFDRSGHGEMCFTSVGEAQREVEKHNGWKAAAPAKEKMFRNVAEEEKTSEAMVVYKETKASAETEGEAKYSPVAKQESPPDSPRGRGHLTVRRQEQYVACVKELLLIVQTSAAGYEEIRMSIVQGLLAGRRGELQRDAAIARFWREHVDQRWQMPAGISLKLHPSFRVSGVPGDGLEIVPVMQLLEPDNLHVALEDLVHGWKGSPYGPSQIELFGKDGVKAREEAVRKEAEERKAREEGLDKDVMQRLSDGIQHGLEMGLQRVSEIEDWLANDRKEDKDTEPSLLTRVRTWCCPKLTAAGGLFGVVRNACGCSSESLEFMNVVFKSTAKNWRRGLGETPIIMWLGMAFSFMGVTVSYIFAARALKLTFLEDSRESLDVAAEASEATNDFLRDSYNELESQVNDSYAFTDFLNDLDNDTVSAIDASFAASCAVSEATISFPCANATVSEMITLLTQIQDLATNDLLPAIDDAIETNEAFIASSESTVESLSRWERDWNVSLSKGIIIGAVIACLITLLPPASLTLHLKGLRRGKTRAAGDYKPNLYTTKFMPAYVGIALSSSIFGFMLVSLLFTAAIFIVINDDIIEFLIDYVLRPFLAWLGSFLLLKHVFNPLVLQGWCSDGRSIKRPVSFAYAIFTLMLYQLFTGFFSAIFRLVSMLGWCFVAVLRLDMTIFPKELAGMDAGYMAFCSNVYFRHQHSNAVLQEAVRAFADIDRGEETEGEGEGGSTEKTALETEKSEAHRRARNRWQVAYTLLKNPALVKLRRGVEFSLEEGDKVHQE
mmetsp:Transcript_14298/g.42886  ORF Transcript_14298/g.42886 Transcript_14298/m.42886 type:complete len:995 (-) Transcript_14298:239-3223(-)